jgi:DNA-binding beta-propeller fold protein YncE
MAVGGGAPQPRKIDLLTTTVSGAEQASAALLDQIQTREAAAREEIKTAIAERIAALQDREKVLLANVTTVVTEKKAALKSQIKSLDLSDLDAQVILATDAVITFEIDEDILEKIPELGAVGEASTYPDKCTAAGPALVALKEGRPSFFWVSAYDRTSERRVKGGDDVQIVMSGSFADQKVEDMKDGRYKISFKPEVAEEASCEVTINGETAAGFPQSLTVRPPTEYTSIALEGEKTRLGSSDGSMMQSSASAVLDPTNEKCLLADGGNHRIQVFDFAKGEVLDTYGKIGKGPGQFRCPSGICVVQQQSVVRTVVTDMLNHRIQIFEGTGPKLLKTLGSKGAGAGQLLFPRGCAANEDGEVFVCDQGNHRIVVFNALTMTYVRTFGSRGQNAGQFNTPLSVTVDLDQRILVSDKNHRVQVFDKDAQLLFQFGSKGRKKEQFNYPAALAVDDESHIFVCDTNNSRVQVFSPEGKFVHLWGQVDEKGKRAAGPPPPAEAEEGEEPVVQEEDPSKIKLEKPMGIALARDGTIWVVDHDLNQVLVY